MPILKSLVENLCWAGGHRFLCLLDLSPAISFMDCQLTPVVEPLPPQMNDELEIISGVYTDPNNEDWTLSLLWCLQCIQPVLHFVTVKLIQVLIFKLTSHKKSRVYITYRLKPQMIQLAFSCEVSLPQDERNL